MKSLPNMKVVFVVVVAVPLWVTEADAPLDGAYFPLIPNWV